MVKEEISGKDRGGRQRGRETQRDRENKKIINITAYAFIIAGTRDHGNRGVLFKGYVCRFHSLAVVCGQVDLQFR